MAVKKSLKHLPSDNIKKGLERMPNRALLYGTGLHQSHMDRPFIGIASSFTDLIPGHIQMRSLPWAIRVWVFLCRRAN